MEIRYQVGSMSEFRCGDLFGFVSSVFISQLDHLVQEFACLSVINFRVYYLRNLYSGSLSIMTRMWASCILLEKVLDMADLSMDI